MRNLVLIYILLLFGSFYAYSQSEDILSPLRTNKKILTVERASAPYYAIQILALKLTPQNPDFFVNVDNAREFICDDGYVRYVVGEYQTFSDAALDLETVKAKGYSDAFVVNTAKLGLEPQKMNTLVIDPDKYYLIQLSAFRFPVYLTYFDGIDKVLEFYMKDKIYRYCTDKIIGSEVEAELKKIKNSGYKNAFIVDYEKYLPFKIE